MDCGIFYTSQIWLLIKWLVIRDCPFYGVQLCGCQTPEYSHLMGNLHSNRLPLSPYHKIFYDEWKINPGSWKYNIVIDQSFSALLDVGRLRSGLFRFISEYVILNSHIIAGETELYWTLNADVRELEYFSTSCTHSMENYAMRPFDLENGQLYRFAVFCEANGNFRFIAVFHHILIDAALWDGMINEISKYYNDAAYKVAITADDQVRSIISTTEHLYQKLEAQDAVSKLFWSDYLQDAEAVDLRFIKRTGDLKEFYNNTTKSAIKELRFSFTEDVVHSLQQIENKYLLSKYRYSQIIFALLLSKYTAQSKFAISYPMSIKEHKSLIYGAGVNTNFFVYNISNNTTIQDIINHTVMCVNAMKAGETHHGYYLVSDIIAATNKGYLDVFFAQTSLRETKFNFDGVEVVSINHDFEVDVPSTLIFEQEITRQGLYYSTRYNITEVDAVIMQNFVNHYKKLFVAVLGDLSRDMSSKLALEYLILSADEYQQIVYEWNDTHKAYPEHNTVHGLFEEQVARTPNNVAVVYENTTLSYAVLNQKANQLASYLRKTYHIRGDDLVALCLSRSEHMLIAILAILKAGGAYVPIDPSYPEERIGYILEDTRAKVILTNEVYKEKLRAMMENNTGVDTQLEFVDSMEIRETLKGELSDNLEQSITSKNLAYVIYTSGTTGKPKGVMIEHNSLVSFCYKNNFLEVTHDFNVLAYSNYVFDGSVFDIFYSLCNGAKVYLITQDNILDIQQLLTKIKNHRINTLFITTALFEQYTKMEENDPLNGVTTILFGGEKVDKELILKRLTKNIENRTRQNIIHVYGPTENIVFSTYCNLSNCEENLIPIGKKLDDKALYVLDTNRSPLPVGAIGELYIGGAGLARGYLNRPELTSARFIVNPFQSKEEREQGKNSRLYKTGDLVRYLPDGNLEYIGRNDFQVKIRGFRIELKEIEAILTAYPQVKQSVVLMKESKGNTGDLVSNKYLVGYYVAENKLDETAIRSHLALHLPEYMIPSVLIHLEKLPLNLSGKLDHNALPKAKFSSGNDYIAPRNELERRVCGIFANVLNLNEDSVGVTDSFFRLGGNSILAIKVANKLFSDLEVKVSVATVLQHKTIATLVEQLISNNVKIVNIPVTNLSSNSRYQLSFAQERLWFIDEYGGVDNAYNIPLVMQIRDGVDLRTLEQALHMVVSRHEVLHSLIGTDSNGNGYQEVCDLTKKPLVINKQLVISQAELEISINCEVNHIYTLSEEYPIRISIFSQVQPRHNTAKIEHHYLSVIIHHIAFDGWSIAVFFYDLLTYYNYCKQQTSEARSSDIVSRLDLPNLSLQYKDFAIWQRSHLTGKCLSKQLDYWLRRLHGYETLNLPLDKVRPAQISYTGDSMKFTLDETTSGKLRELAKSLNVTLYSVLLSGYYILLSSYSNQNDIVVGVPVANRHYSQLEHIIGCFVNSLALRSQINHDSLVVEYIRATGKEVIEAQLHQDLPFEKLVAELNSAKDPSRHPIFQVMFEVASFDKPTTQQEELFQVYFKDFWYEIAKFDLTFVLDDSSTKIVGIASYSTSLFVIDTIVRLVNTYKHILDQLSKLNLSSNIKIAELSYLNQEDYQKVIHIWNKTEKKYPEHKTIHQLFEDQVARAPDNIALLYGNVILTYQELNLRANRLARFLMTKYVLQADDLVALCLDRSEHMIITLLAVMKTGAAYVPMDPGYPDERIGYILRDTKARVILANALYANKLGLIISDRHITSNDPVATGLVPIEFIDDATIQAKLEKFSSANLSQNITSHNLAYVIYTSGTTGKPKGVMIEHKNIVNYISLLPDKYYLQPLERILLLANYVFDASVEHMFLALTTGCALVVASADDIRNPDELMQLIVTKGVTHVDATPGYLEILDHAQLSRLHRLSSGGDYLSAGLYERLRTHVSVIINSYGPTETTVAALININQLGIGKPLDNYTAYVLNSYLRPLPIGSIGELYIGGAGVARGYLNNTELTQSKFITNPFATQSEQTQNKNTRLYKTGDLVRYLADGSLEYCGRNDLQIKIGGLRIELGEIEDVLKSYQGVEQVVVVIKEMGDKNQLSIGNKCLVGYYVANNRLDEEAMITYISGKLPDYMLPSKLMWLKRFPLTINGKLDRHALPEVTLSNLNNSNYVEPLTTLEIQVCQIFAEVLNLASNGVGVTDNFFRLGGSSILAIKLISKINQLYGARLKVVDVFVDKTPANLIAKMQETKNVYQAIVRLNTSFDKTNMFMIHPGHGGCEVYAALAHSLTDVYSCYGVDSYNLYNTDKIVNLHELALYYIGHIEQIMFATRQKKYVLLGWSLGGQIAAEIALILESRGVKDIRVIMLDTIIPDQEIIDLRNKCYSNSELDTKIKEWLLKEDCENCYITKVLEDLAVVVDLANTVPLDKLKFTKIHLFKAMLVEDDLPQSYSKKLGLYALSITDNNLSGLCTDLQQISVVHVANAHHGNIIKQDKLLSSILQVNNLLD